MLRLGQPWDRRDSAPLPTAITTASAARRSSSPTRTRRSPSSRPLPRNSVIPRLSSHGSWLSSLRCRSPHRGAPARPRHRAASRSPPPLRARAAPRRVPAPGGTAPWTACRRRTSTRRRPVRARRSRRACVLGQPAGDDLSGGSGPDHDHVKAVLHGWQDIGAAASSTWAPQDRDQQRRRADREQQRIPAVAGVAELDAIGPGADAHAGERGRDHQRPLQAAVDACPPTGVIRCAQHDDARPAHLDRRGQPSTFETIPRCHDRAGVARRGRRRQWASRTRTVGDAQVVALPRKRRAQERGTARRRRRGRRPAPPRPCPCGRRVQPAPSTTRTVRRVRSTSRGSGAGSRSGRPDIRRRRARSPGVGVVEVVLGAGHQRRGAQRVADLLESRLSRYLYTGTAPTVKLAPQFVGSPA